MIVIMRKGTWGMKGSRDVQIERKRKEEEEGGCSNIFLRATDCTSEDGLCVYWMFLMLLDV